MTVMNGKKSYVKPEELIVNELIRALEDGVPVWRKEWSCKGGFRNLLTGKNYQGSNPALLCISSAVRGWHLPLFIGGGQAKSIGCLPKKGSKSARIMQPLQRSFELKDKDENGEVQFGSYMSYKCVPVFNVADVRGIDEESEKKLQELIDKAVLTSAPRPLDERVKQAHDRLSNGSIKLRLSSKVAIEHTIDQQLMKSLFQKDITLKMTNLI